jgi:hypothetical protein
MVDACERWIELGSKLGLYGVDMGSYVGRFLEVV